MAIIDNRTSIDVFDNTLSTGNYLATSSAAIDTEVFFQGDRSISENMNNSLRSVVYNASSPQDWSSNIFYLLINCGVVGNLVSKAAGGFRIRFCGGANEDANYFEVYVGGSDSWPSSFAGGWTMFIVDVETARADAVTNGWTNGTVPATNAIQCVGFVGQTSGMIRTNDNTWWNGLWRLPIGTPGILVEGQNTAVDWSFADILSTSETNNWGSFRLSDGGAYVCNVPVRFGNATDSVTHGFTDTNSTILWETAEFFSDGNYGFDIAASATNTVDVTWGIKTGTGDAATGAQGVTVQSEAGTNTRWFLTATDPDISSANFYGSTFIHGENFTLEASEVISSTFIDCNSALVSGSVQIRNSVINANTADGVAFMTTNDLTDIKFCTFEFSDGHAIELTTPSVASQTSLGNIFSGYTATASPPTGTDTAVYNNTASAVTISVTSGDVPSFRDGTSASTTVTAAASFVVTNVIAGSEVRFINTGVSPLTELAGVENIAESPEGLSGVTTAVDTNNAGRYTVTYIYDQADAPISANIKTVNNDYVLIETDVTLTASGGELLVSQRLDRNYNNPV